MPFTLEDQGIGNVVTCETEKISEAKIIIKGNNNSIFFGKGSSIGFGDININGNDNVLDFGENNRFGRLKTIVQDGSSLKFGKFCSVEQAYFLSRDGRSIIFGNDCMISFQVDVRTSDAHGIWKVGTAELINAPGDILIEDNVWIGQGAVISKNTVIHSNSVVGMKSFLQNQVVPKNSVVAGTPAKLIYGGIEWTRHIDINKREEELKKNFT